MRALTIFPLMTIPVVTQFNVLEGLLPSGDLSVVIENTQLIVGYFFDLHLFTDLDGQWVVLLDNTEPGQSLQAEQQARLDRDMLLEKKLISKI